MLYLLSVRRTVDLLANHPPARASLRYYLAYCLIAELMLIDSAWVGQNFGQASGSQFWFETVMRLVICVWGVQHAWQCNDQGNGTDFMRRAVFVSVPISLVTLAVSFGLMEGVYHFATPLFYGGQFRDPERAYYLTGYLISFGCLLWYWL